MAHKGATPSDPGLAQSQPHYINVHDVQPGLEDPSLYYPNKSKTCMTGHNTEPTVSYSDGAYAHTRTHYPHKTQGSQGIPMMEDSGILVQSTNRPPSIHAESDQYNPYTGVEPAVGDSRVRPTPKPRNFSVSGSVFPPVHEEINAVKINADESVSPPDTMRDDESSQVYSEEARPPTSGSFDNLTSVSSLGPHKKKVVTQELAAVIPPKLLIDHTSYHEEITGKQAVERLRFMADHQRDRRYTGFLIRHSRIQKLYVLVVYRRYPDHSEVHKGFRIHIEERQGESLYYINQAVKMPSLDTLIRYYYNTRFDAAFDKIGDCVTPDAYYNLYEQEEARRLDLARRQEEALHAQNRRAAEVQRLHVVPEHQPENEGVQQVPNEQRDNDSDGDDDSDGDSDGEQEIGDRHWEALPQQPRKRKCLIL